jgi:acetyl-CoA synthetase (ADP-forming)
LEGALDIIQKAKEEGRTILSEYESKEILRAYDIPVTKETEVGDEKTLLKAVRDIGFPLVLKGSGADLSHKTERGLVRVDIRNEEEAKTAFKGIMDELKDNGGRVLVQEMVKGERELVVGLTYDDQFGPCVMFGLGGIFTEILKDIAFRVAPLEKRDALEMMQEIKARKILDSVRGMPAADLDKLCDILIKVGNIGLEQEAIKEIDINPVILSGDSPVAVDALVVLKS